VPQTYSSVAQPGMTVKLEFAEHPGRTFDAKLVRTAEALDPTARTLLVELQLDNADRVLLPGGYTQVHLTLPAPAAAVRVPASALLFRAEGLRVATVEGGDAAAKDANGNARNQAHVKLRPVTLGRDFGAEVEIATGLQTGDSIVANPPDSLNDGEIVNVAAPAAGGTGS
jgi:multidrug efflux pump subunit AcrA (membrane-fusion protein)